jgi:hypothetical protein
MPLRPADIIPVPQRIETLVGTVTQTGGAGATIELRPGLSIRVQASGVATGQRVLVAAPGGDVSRAQVVAPLVGERGKMTHVAV